MTSPEWNEPLPNSIMAAARSIVGNARRVNHLVLTLAPILANSPEWPTRLALLQAERHAYMTAARLLLAYTQAGRWQWSDAYLRAMQARVEREVKAA